jgi:hypothetical protein
MAGFCELALVSRLRIFTLSGRKRRKSPAGHRNIPIFGRRGPETGFRSALRDRACSVTGQILRLGRRQIGNVEPALPHGPGSAKAWLFEVAARFRLWRELRCRSQPCESAGARSTAPNEERDLWQENWKARLPSRPGALSTRFRGGLRTGATIAAAVHLGFPLAQCPSLINCWIGVGGRRRGPKAPMGCVSWTEVARLDRLCYPIPHIPVAI